MKHDTDVQEIRAMLAPANPCPPGGLDGAANDPVGRAAYARVTRPGAASSRRAAARSHRTVFRVAAVGGLAVAIAAGGTIAQNIGGTDKDGTRHSVVPGLPAAPAANAQEVLHRAADNAARAPFTPPRPDQWIYTVNRSKVSPKPDEGQAVGPDTPLKTETARQWVNYNGNKLAWYEKGRLVTSATGGGTPPTDYPTVSRMPRDADGMLAWARKQRTPGDANSGAYAMLSSLLYNNPVMPPAQTAATYRALAKIPGVRLDRTAKDLGRPVLSVSLVIGGWMADETLLDPSTYAFRGHRSRIVKDHVTDWGGTYKKGLVEVAGVRLTVRVVDRPGQVS
ncbi:CU044_5270 family protein [Actinomadura roseirufa]|uniref:CU044_5270 family protein n=1 Tax=Actinomadura roseirufa TaxID=2094049 RepID=UPI0010418D09|nr:CU044_5270 family protein [Actinomadura roseirufa]